MWLCHQNESNTCIKVIMLLVISICSLVLGGFPLLSPSDFNSSHLTIFRRIYFTLLYIWTIQTILLKNCLFQGLSRSYVNIKQTTKNHIFSSKMKKWGGGSTLWISNLLEFWSICKSTHSVLKLSHLVKNIWWDIVFNSCLDQYLMTCMSNTEFSIMWEWENAQCFSTRQQRA